MPFLPRGYTLRDHLVPQRAESRGREGSGRETACRAVTLWILRAGAEHARAWQQRLLRRGLHRCCPTAASRRILARKRRSFSFSVSYTSSNPTRNAQAVWGGGGERHGCAARPGRAATRMTEPGRERRSFRSGPGRSRSTRQPPRARNPHRSTDRSSPSRNLSQLRRHRRRRYRLRRHHPLPGRPCRRPRRRRGQHPRRARPRGPAARQSRARGQRRRRRPDADADSSSAPSSSISASGTGEVLSGTAGPKATRAPDEDSAPVEAPDASAAAAADDQTRPRIPLLAPFLIVGGAMSVAGAGVLGRQWYVTRRR